MRIIAVIALAALMAGACERDRPAAGASQLLIGQAVYEKHCASCHGGNLEGQPNWRQRRPDGKLPAPPHDQTGHTWHHADEALFELVKRGMTAFAGPDYKTDMPAYAGLLSDDEIRAVLAYIKSRWPVEIRDKQSKIDAAHRSRK